MMTANMPQEETVHTQSADGRLIFKSQGMIGQVYRDTHPDGEQISLLGEVIHSLFSPEHCYLALVVQNREQRLYIYRHDPPQQRWICVERQTLPATPMKIEWEGFESLVVLTQRKRWYYYRDLEAGEWQSHAT